LKLQGDERKLFAEELRALPVAERKDVMELTNSWIEKGREEGLAKGLRKGRQAGAADLILRQLRRRLRALPKTTAMRIASLPLDQLEPLGEALLDFNGKADLHRWLSARRR
jgi:hypothetical protein